MCKKMSFVFSFILSAFVFCAGSVYAAGWTPPLDLELVETENTDIMIVHTSDNIEHVSGCMPNHWVVLADTDARRNRIYATLLTAIVNGNQVKLWYTDTCSHWDYHGMSAVMLLK